jgi:hypothetical protein
MTWGWLLALLVLASIPTLADEITYPAVDGVMGLESEDGDGWLAISVAIPENHALEGILWYSNDGLVVYPTVSVGTGHVDGPGSLTEMAVVAELVAGGSSAWSTMTFSQPIGASLGRLYVVLAFPASAVFTAEGEGGGPAVGFCAGGLGTDGWVSGDGEFWMPLHEESDFAVMPVLIPLEDGMQVKSMDGDPDRDLPPVTQPYLAASPNPFNPVTEIRFGLTRASDVRLDIYNLRGARVARLVSEPMQAGHHVVPWTGVDGAGRKVASGVYFARLEAGDVTFNQKLMLVK